MIDDIIIDEDDLYMMCHELLGRRIGDQVYDVLVILGEDNGVIAGLYDLFFVWCTGIQDIHGTDPCVDDPFDFYTESTIQIPILGLSNGYEIPMSYDKSNISIFSHDFTLYFYDITFDYGEKNDRLVLAGLEKIVFSIVLPYSKYYKDKGEFKYYFNAEIYTEEYDQILVFSTEQYNGS